MKIGTKVSLGPGEQRACGIIAKRRSETCRRVFGKSMTRKDDRSGYELHLQGIAGEFAFCKLFNLFPDMLTHARSAQAGEDFGDAVLHDGRRVDIKTTHYPHGRLIVASWAKPVVDLYALMIGVYPDYEFKGFIAAREMVRESRLTDLGRGPSFVADQAELEELH